MDLLENLGELGGLMVGFVLTLFILSFIIRDNPLYRLAVHILVGVSAAYALVIVIQELFIPVFGEIIDNPSEPTNLLWIVPLILSLLLLVRTISRVSWMGNGAMAVLIAVGAAVGLVGAITGTLLPLIMADYGGDFASIVVAILTVCALLYFRMTGRLNEENEVVLPFWYRSVGTVGRVVVTVALAGIFAGVLSTSLVLLVDRVAFFADGFSSVFAALGS
jgi:hypothetical protein